LEEIGFIWDPLEQQWEEGFAALASFEQRVGNCNVPQGYKEGDYRLGTWVGKQRSKKDTLSPERRQRLEEIGFIWDPLEQQWEEGFAALVSFEQRVGNCKVPRGHKEGDYRLGTWVSKQRSKKDTLSPERRQRLEEIGFVWDTRKRS